MITKFKVYGYSDDLIEIEGDIEEEFYCYDDSGVLAFYDGTLLKVQYDNDGIWRFTLLVQGYAFNVLTHCATNNPDDAYSDVVEFTDFTASEVTKWVVLGTEYHTFRP